MVASWKLLEHALVYHSHKHWRQYLYSNENDRNSVIVVAMML